MFIHRVKLSETKTKGQDGYRKNKTWRLKELKAVDGKDEHQVLNALCLAIAMKERLGSSRF